MCITKGAGLLHINSRNISRLFVGAVNNVSESSGAGQLKIDCCARMTVRRSRPSLTPKAEKMASALRPRTSIFGSRARPPGAPGGTSIEESRGRLGS